MKFWVSLQNIATGFESVKLWFSFGQNKIKRHEFYQFFSHIELFES